MLKIFFDQPLSRATLATAAIAAVTLNATPAHAVTFNFKGEFWDDGTPIEGTYTIDTEVFEYVATQPLWTTEVENPLDFFSLKVDGETIFEGIPQLSELDNIAAENGQFYGTYLYLYVPELRFVLGLGEFDTVTCLERECPGTFFYERSSPPNADFYGSLTHTPVLDREAESVPEPTTAIALGLVGALMLRRQGKYSDSGRV